MRLLIRSLMFTLFALVLVGCATPVYVCLGAMTPDGQPAMVCQPHVK